MRIYLRLNQFLRIDKHRRPLSRLADAIGIKTDQLRNLLENDKPMIPRDVLAKVCDYLVENKLANAADLPGALFARSPEKFWHLLWDRHRIELCMGVRPDKNFNDHVVIAADSILQASLLHGATEIPDAYTPRLHRRMKIIKPQLVPCWVYDDEERNKQICQSASDYYAKFVKSQGDKALVCLGSIKSNPVVECVVSDCFKSSEPFVSQDDVTQASQRACPFMFAYRKQDPQPPSICGGMQIAVDKRTQAGIYFEEKENNWRCVPWRANADAALVFYRLQKTVGQLDLILGGYSGRATRCLAEYIASIDRDLTELWPPAIQNAKVDIGAFVIEFKLGKAEQSFADNANVFQTVEGTKVHKIGAAALERRLADA